MIKTNATTRFMMLRRTMLVLITLLFIPSSPLLAREVTDIDITLAIESELLLDEGVPSHLIDVDTNEGIVSLTGFVNNILAKERAAKIAETVKGVRSVVNRIKVKPPARADSEILADIEAALLADPATESFEVGTSVKKGVVTLTGTVDSWQEKQLAATVAKGVKGVTDVKNEIKVEYKSTRPDKEIKAEIERRLKWDVWVDESLLEVNVQNGTVILTGNVGSAAEKSRAFADSWVNGIKSVNDSGLAVDWLKQEEMRRSYSYAAKSDEEIERAVKDALLYDPRVLSFNPDVEVEEGVVTLTGTVSNLNAKKAAEQVVEHTVGVWRVKNFLKVRSEKQQSDAEIKAKVVDALAQDPFVERYAITPVVSNGKVFLYGTVDTLFERMRAEDVASRVIGVIDVENNLELTVVPTTRKSDWEIEQDIEDELFWSPYVDADQVNVSVDDGVATLTGAVDTWSEWKAAQDNALEGGAIRVRNDLNVKYGPPYFLP